MEEIIKLARSLEVIIAIFIGAFICWLGYRLFEKGVSGKASLSAEREKIKFQLLNASPGIFFALFGSVLVLISVSQKTKITEYPKKDGEPTKRVFEKPADDEIDAMRAKLVSTSDWLLAKGKEAKEQKAIEALKALLEVDRQFAEAYNRLAQIYMKDDANTTEALRLARIATQLQRHRADFYITLADVYIKIGDTNEAIKALQIASENDPGNTDIQQRLQLLKKP